jgi:hypothetical protein
VAKWLKTEVRRMIVDAVTPVVSGAGFRFKKASEAFVRKIEGGRQELVLPLVDYNPVFHFSFALCTRFEAVQDIANRFSGSTPKYHSMTLTSITQLEFLGLAAKPPNRVHFEVCSEAALIAVMPEVLAILRERVLPFFDEYRDIAAINRGLNPEGAERVLCHVGFPDRREFDATNKPYRAMTGVVAAYLANDPRLDALICAYRSQLSDTPEHDRSKFENLVGHLNGERRLTNG